MWLARFVALVFSLGALTFAIGFIKTGLVMVQQGGGDLLYGMPGNMALLLWIPLLQAVALLIMLGCAFNMWQKSHGHWGSRLHYAIITCAAIAWMVFTVQFNLLPPIY